MDAGVDVKVVERDGARIAYRVHGPATAPVLLLGHGLLFDYRMWDPLVPSLAARYRLLVVDVRGHGGSTAPGPFTLEDLAADWLAVLDAEGISKVTLVGLSMGGMTALRFALSWPERVMALALIDSSAGPEGYFKYVKYRVLVAAWRRLGSIRLIGTLVAPVLFGRTTRREQPALVRREIDQILAKHPDDLEPAILAVIGRKDVAGRLSAITQPTLVLVGAEDKACPPRCSDVIAAGIAGSTLVSVPRCGHMSTLEMPAAVLAALGPFLAAHTGREP